MNSEFVTREILGNIPRGVVWLFYAAAATATGWAVWKFSRRFRLYNQAVTSKKIGTEAIWRGVCSVARYLTFHQQLLRDRFAGTAHLLMFYGFFILFIGTCLVFLENDTPLHFFYGWFYLIASLVIDLGGIAFLVGLGMFLYRRQAGTSGRILRAWWVTAAAWLLVAIGVTGFLLEGARIAEEMPAFERWSVAGYTIAALFSGLGISGGRAVAVHQALWVTHAALCVGFFALLPWKFFGHMLYGAISWSIRSDRQRGQLRELSESRKPGAVTWQELEWRDLLHADACTTCGRCNEVCPAAAADKPLRPREVVLGLRGALDAAEKGSRSGRLLLAEWIRDETAWSCTTCGACNEACPVGIDVYDKLIEVRRGRVESGTIPQKAEQVFQRIDESQNPYGKPADDRLLWAQGLDVPVAREGERIELLYWVGCAGAFDPEGRSVARDLVKILRHLKVNFRVLGKRECCTGDPARRMGEEGQFRHQAAEVLSRLAEHGVNRVLVNCPHCFNTFRNEYPALGGRFEVEHHSQFLARMLADGRLKLPTATSRPITFHDPCYLGRGNGETEAPREVLRAAAGLEILEMSRHGRDSFCCGAGGGSVWLDVPGMTRIENLRVEEAAETGAATIATGCPFCKSMLTAGALSTGAKGMEVKDLAELVVEAMGL